MKIKELKEILNQFNDDYVLYIENLRICKEEPTRDEDGNLCTDVIELLNINSDEITIPIENVLISQLSFVLQDV